MKKWLLVMSSIVLTGALIMYVRQIGKITMHSDPVDMKQEVLKKIPIGSSIQDATKIMEENSFAVERRQNTDFSEFQDGDSHKQIIHKGEDFLICYKKSTPFLFVTREWIIIIVHVGDVVSDVFVNIGLTGP